MKKLTVLAFDNPSGALGGAFWGTFIGLIFLTPVLGMAVGAVSGALGGRVSDIGIDDSFIKEIGEKIGSVGSALFMLVAAAQPDRVLEELESEPSAEPPGNPYLGRSVRISSPCATGIAFRPNRSVRREFPEPE